MYSQTKKLLIFFILAIVFTFLPEAFFFSDIACAENAITSRTGTLRITRPDGTVLVVGKDESLGPIPSGSTVEVLSGSIDVAPTAGFIQVVVRDSVATVEAGNKVTASIEPKTKMADFQVYIGKVSVITGNTTSTINSGQQAQIVLDRITGIVNIRSIRGNIETVTAGVRALVMQGGIAWIGVNPRTREVRIDSMTGMVEVISPKGERFILARGESRDIQGSMVGEVLTFPGEAVEMPALLVEEPPEPEVPEASPYRP